MVSGVKSIKKKIEKQKEKGTRFAISLKIVKIQGPHQRPKQSPAFLGAIAYVK